MPEIKKFARSDLHGNAAAALDVRADKLLSCFRREPRKDKVEAFRGRQSPEMTITSADMLVEPLVSITDMAGQRLGFEFFDGADFVKIDGDNFLKFRKLSEDILKTRPFNDGISIDYLLEKQFEWWRGRFRNEEKRGLSDYLLDCAESDVGYFEAIVPISNFETELPFTFGNLLIKPIMPYEFERAFRHRSGSPEEAVRRERSVEHLKKRYCHTTGVVSKVFGEKKFCEQVCRDNAQFFSEILRVCSPPSVSWNIRFDCVLTDSDLEPMSSLFELRHSKISSISRGMISAPTFRWRVSASDLEYLAGERGLAHFEIYFSDAKLTPLQARFRATVAAYAQAIAAKDTGDRLIYAMSALEGFLLGSEQGIQSTVADRLAFVIAKEPDKRQAVVKNFKEAYKLRSKKIHHSISVDDESTLSQFFLNCGVFFINIIHNLNNFETQSDFLGALDRMKYS